jgi:O-antigen/teichoic acid export membrane protein
VPLFDGYKTDDTKVILPDDAPGMSDGRSILKRRLLSGGTWGLGGRMATVLGGFVTNALLARLLSPQELGTYFLALSVVTLGAVIGSLGLNQAGVRFLAASVGLEQFGRARSTMRVVFSGGLLGAIGIGLAYVLLGDLMGSLFAAPALAAVSGLMAGWAAVATVQGLLAELFRGLHDIRMATLFGALTSGNGVMSAGLLIACLALLLASRGEASLVTVMGLATGSGFASALTAGWFLRRKMASISMDGEDDRVTPKEILRVAWPLLLTNVTLFALAQADVWIVGAFRSQEDVAVYGAAARLVTLVAIPLLVFNAFVPPMVAEMHAQGRREELERVLRSTATLSGIPSFFAFALFALAGGPLLGLLFGDYYGAGASVLAVLSVGQFARVWCGSCGTALMMTGHQRIVMFVTAFSGLVAIAVALGTVGRYGMLGVATATSLGNTLQSILSWLMVKRATGMWTHFSLTKLFGFLRTVRVS